MYQFEPFWPEIGYGLCTLVLNWVCFLEEATFAYVAGTWKLWALERLVKGEETPARKAHENRFNSHSVSADISNWLRGSQRKK